MTEREQLYLGVDVYTVDHDLPEAEAVAVRDGTIVAVGSAHQCRSAIGSHCEAIDLEGRALLPGFIDTHLHPMLFAFFDMNLDLRGTADIDDLQRKIRSMERDLSPGAWIIGLHLDEQALEERRLPTRHDLDRACPDVPVLLVKHDGHTVVANTAAIAAAGCGPTSQDPPGGSIDREADGFPAGPFRETATDLLFKAMPMPDLDAMIAGAGEAFEKLAACGITSIGAVLQTGDEGPAGSSGALELAGMELTLPVLPTNLYGLLIADELSTFETALKSPLNQGSPGARRIGAIKIYTDGTFGSCTAFMKNPFSDHPERQGFLVHSAEEIYRRMVMAHTAGLQVAMHAIGDAANQTCVDLYARLLGEYPREDHRHRLEHASLLSAPLIDQIKRLGLVISTQPLFIHSERHWLEKRLGPERAGWTYPLRSLLDAGVKVAGASDAPVESPRVLDAIQCCVTREGFRPEQAITVEEAIRMFTLDAAFAQFEESIKGSIEVGKRADMVVLSHNPTKVPPQQLSTISVERTICGGVQVFPV